MNEISGAMAPATRSPAATAPAATVSAATAPRARTLAGQPITIGQAVGQAETVLTRLLARVLTETGTSRQTYLAMQRLAALGGVVARESYLADLSDWLGLDLWAAGDLVVSLAESGVLAEDAGAIMLAPGGADLQARIGGSSSALTRALVAPLDPADVEVTIATLAGLTTRARALLTTGADEPA